MYVGALVLRQPLDYRERPFYQLLLRASVSDSNNNSSSSTSSCYSSSSGSVVESTRELILIMRPRAAGLCAKSASASRNRVG